MQDLVSTRRGNRLAPAGHAANDDHLIKLWLHGKSRNTVEAYARDIDQFRTFTTLELSNVKLQDIHDWLDSLSHQGLAESTITRKVASLKSLFTFGHKIGYFVFNVGAAVSTPKVADDLAERILDRDAITRILAVVDDHRDRVLIRLFYASGGRVSELQRLRWRSVLSRTSNGVANSGQVMLRGKGNKTRNVLLSAATWSKLCSLRDDERQAGYGGADDPVFRSRKRGFLSRQQIWRIVKKAARSAGLPDAVSPHWLRHAHASHALDEGAPVHLVKETLGHKSLVTTSRYTHAKPDDSSAKYLDV